ncbi:MAG: ergothioneine biosynthesis protein EgtB [Chlamydiales bacterium]|jgi:ergothioneine biosynthesis protein EgtB
MSYLHSKTLHEPRATEASRLTPEALLAHYDAIRQRTLDLSAPLEPEDCVIQSMPEASPTRWHLAHTSWFLETFVLAEAEADYKPFHPGYDALFNSYYETVGAPFPRPSRGLLSRPTVVEVLEYRDHVDRRMRTLLRREVGCLSQSLLAVVELGLNHEEQHQELILTDIKHALAQNPLHPIYREKAMSKHEPSTELSWTRFEPGLCKVGHDGKGFAFDNETPRHRQYLHGYELGTRLVTCGEYIEFIEDGGYERPELWLAEGIGLARSQGWRAPLYWKRDGGRWMEFSLHGMNRVRDSEPVGHVSYFEADAFARWSGARLPTEVELEYAVESMPVDGNFLESDEFHPRPSTSGPGTLDQLFGDLWEWTSSSYAAYPGYRAPGGALGEYNGKFMCNQYVLRGGSCATSKRHLRSTYRNFFPADARWQFSGIRLARAPLSRSESS